MALIHRLGCSIGRRSILSRVEVYGKEWHGGSLGPSYSSSSSRIWKVFRELSLRSISPSRPREMN